MPKYYGYIRVSTETQAEKGYGLDAQQQVIANHCALNNITFGHILSRGGSSRMARLTLQS